MIGRHEMPIGEPGHMHMLEGSLHRIGMLMGETDRMEMQTGKLPRMHKTYGSNPPHAYDNGEHWPA